MIDALAYVGFTSPHASDWRSFGPEVLGLQLVADAARDTVLLRNDDAAWRIAIMPGEVDDLAWIGWEVDGPAGLDSATRALAAAGFDVHSGDTDLAAARQVAGIAWFEDPFGFRHELVHGLARASEPFTPGRTMAAGFVTGDGGLGHLVLIVPDLATATDFFLGTLGFEHSDDLDNGLVVRFAHCDPRHHTLAFAEVPGMVGVHHLMIEVRSAADVDAALAIAEQRDLALPMSLGEHTNDHMRSFYVRTPSGFEVEYGSDGLRIQPDVAWEIATYDAISVWGHEPPAEPMLPGILHPAEAPA